MKVNPMLFPQPMKAALCLWLVFVVYMIVAAMNVKRTEVRESTVSRLGYMVVILLGAAFVFTRYFGIGGLGLRFVPSSPTPVLIGMILVLLGLAFAVWARRTLGRNWSSSVTLKEDHELVQRGPYAFFHHPLYVGIGAALLGTAIIQGQRKSIVGVLLCYAGLWKKARTENAFLRQRFGERAKTR